MKRKETYASTGPRMTVRFFGGYDFTAADLSKTNWAEAAYGKGVPMGGDLAAAPASKAPSFIVMAAKDPSGANLDRIQIIKGWVEVEVAGVIKRFELSYSFSSDWPGHILLDGSRTFNFSDFKLSPPKKMAGLIKIKDAFDVNFKLILRTV